MWDEGREREIPASAAKSLWCQGMLMDIVYVVSRECLVKLLELSAGDRWVFISRGMRGIYELGVGEHSF